MSHKLIGEFPFFVVEVSQIRGGSFSKLPLWVLKPLNYLGLRTQMSDWRI
jgi:hypothetical protein